MTGPSAAEGDIAPTEIEPAPAEIDPASGEIHSMLAKVEEIWELAGLSDSVRADGLIEVEKHLAVSREYEQANSKRESRAFIVGILVPTTIFAAAVVLYGALYFPGWPQLWALVGGFAGLVVVQVILGVMTSDMSDRLWALAVIWCPLFLFVGAAWLLYQWWRGALDLSAAPATVFGLVGICLGVVYYFSTIGLMLLAAYLAFKFSRRLGRDFAEAMVVSSLTSALVMAGNEKDWRVARNRQSIAEEIEAAAYWIQLILRPRKGEDSETVSWLSRRRETAVTNLRELKRRALVPRSDTRAWLVERLSTDLLASAYGSLDDVSHDEIGSTSQPRRLRVFLLKAWRVLRGLIASLIPLGIVVFLIRQDVLSGPVVTPLLAVTIALPAVVLLRVLDPAVLDDVKRTQEVLPKLLGRGSDNK